MDYKEAALEARREVLTLVYRASTSHIASNFSVIDIATVLYANLNGVFCEYNCASHNYGVYNCYPHNCLCKLHPNHPSLENNDEVVWSAGWKAATIYYFLWKQGKITREQLESFPKPPMIGLAEVSVPGVHVSGGSMGQGLGVAIGMALGKKRAGEKGIVYCIMSDGEMQEGTTWEGALFAGHHKLDNLCVIIDYNKWTAMGRTKDVADLEPFENKWMAFNWIAGKIDGHDHHMILGAIRMAHGFERPHCIIADTIKGKGVEAFSDKILYHYKNIDDETYKQAMLELQ